MKKKHFSFQYNRITRKGMMMLDEKYIEISFNKKDVEQKNCSSASSSGVGGYGLNLLRRK